MRFGNNSEHLLQAMMSRTRTMNPTIPPPVPACHGSAPWAVMGAASASMNMESWSSMERARLNMVAVFGGCETWIKRLYVECRDESKVTAAACCIVYSTTVMTGRGAVPFEVSHRLTSLEILP